MSAPSGPAWTPLLDAAHRGDVEALRGLLAADAPLGGRTERGDTAVHLAVFGGHEGALELLLRAPPRGDETGESAAAAARALTNATNAAGFTPLMLTMLSEAPTRLGCARALLAHGADSTLSTAQGWTAGLLAAQRGHAAALALLLGHEARGGVAPLLDARTHSRRARTSR